MSSVDDSNIEDGECDCIHFDEGDWVQSRLNPAVRGIVVNESDFGRYYHVQLVGSLEIRSFNGVTLQHFVPQNEGASADSDNVIDFTKERELRRNTKTRGAA